MLAFQEDTLCDQEVRPRQHALECETCFQWQHRLCNTGVSAADYRRLINDEIEIIFHCVNCMEIGDPIHPADEMNRWHNRLNKKATPEGVGVYKLIPKLRREAQLVFASVAAEDLNRDIDPKYVSLQCRLKDAWTKYEANEISTTHFLKMVSNLYGVPDKE